MEAPDGSYPGQVLFYYQIWRSLSPSVTSTRRSWCRMLADERDSRMTPIRRQSDRSVSSPLCGVAHSSSAHIREQEPPGVAPSPAIFSHQAHVAQHAYRMQGSPHRERSIPRRAAPN